MAISLTSAHLLLLPEQLPLQPDTSDTLRAQPITQPVSTTPFPPNPGSAALVTTTADNVATETERMDKEIVVEENTEPATLPVSSTPVPPIPESAAPVTSTTDSVATEIERMDKEILAEQNIDMGTLPVSSTLVPPLNVQDDRPMATISIGRGDICVGIDYVCTSRLLVLVNHLCMRHQDL